LVENPQVALFIGGEHDEAFTARGRAHVADEQIAGSPGWVAVALEVQAIDDHRQGSFSVDSGIGVKWSDERAHEHLRSRVAALRELAHTAA